ncbi:SCO5918 family protein [Streptomyces sp. NPDC020096]
MRVIIARRHFYLLRIDVETAMNGVIPESDTGASVKIGGIAYPLMQVGAVLTRQDRRDFSAEEVFRAMRALGFSCQAGS